MILTAVNLFLSPNVVIVMNMNTHTNVASHHPSFIQFSRNTPLSIAIAKSKTCFLSYSGPGDNEFY